MKKITYVNAPMLLVLLLSIHHDTYADTLQPTGNHTTRNHNIHNHVTYNQAWVNRTLKKLSLREKIGQLFIVDVTVNRQHATGSTSKVPHYTNTDSVNTLIHNYHIGGIIFLGG